MVYIAAYLNFNEFEISLKSPEVLTERLGGGGDDLQRLALAKSTGRKLYKFIPMGFFFLQ
jgi:hypothetical protein